MTTEAKIRMMQPQAKECLTAGRDEKQIFPQHFLREQRHDDKGFPHGSVVKNPPAMQKMQEHRKHRFYPWGRKIPWRRKWQSIPVFLPGKFHGQRSLAGCSPRGPKESDMTEYEHRHGKTC